MTSQLSASRAFSRYTPKILVSQDAGKKIFVKIAGTTVASTRPRRNGQIRRKSRPQEDKRSVLQLVKWEKMIVILTTICGINAFLFKQYQAVVTKYSIKAQHLPMSDGKRLHTKTYIQLLTDVSEIHQAKDTHFDVLSIGSINQTDLSQAQVSSWANHPSVRNFYLATENNDPHPNCSTTLTFKEAEIYRHRCKQRIRIQTLEDIGAYNNLTASLKGAYSNRHWFKQRKNPVGWMCAQHRPPSALAQLLKIYREIHSTHGDQFLPSYLLLVDDDTHLNIDLLKKKLILKEDTNVVTGGGQNIIRQIPHQHTPVVFSGCKIRRGPVAEINLTFPFGGYGTYLSRGAMLRFFQPLYCDNKNVSLTPVGSFERDACDRINNPNAVSLGERDQYTHGMSVSDIMGEFAKFYGYEFCMHSDWVLGYFINYYSISRHVVNDGTYFTQDGPNFFVKEETLHALDASEIYHDPTGHCNANRFNCTSKSLVCHGLSPENMTKLSLYQTTLETEVSYI